MSPLLAIIRCSIEHPPILFILARLSPRIYPSEGGHQYGLTAPLPPRKVSQRDPPGMFPLSQESLLHDCQPAQATLRTINDVSLGGFRIFCHAAEICVSSQHVTGAAGLIPSLQAQCVSLAAAAHARATPLSLPCAEFLWDEALLFIDGDLVVDISLAPDDYRTLIAPPSPLRGKSAGGTTSCTTWTAATKRYGGHPVALRSLYPRPEPQPRRLCATCCSWPFSALIPRPSTR